MIKCKLNKENKLTPATPLTPGLLIAGTLMESVLPLPLSPEEIGKSSTGPGLAAGDPPDGGEGERPGKLSAGASDEITVMASSPIIVWRPLCLLNRLKLWRRRRWVELLLESDRPSAVVTITISPSTSVAVTLVPFVRGSI